MRTLILLLAGCILLATSHVSLAAESRGSRSCSKWIEERRQAEAREDLNKIPVLISKSWFLGFVSGRASRSAQDWLKGTDNESIFLWLDNYCRNKPLQDLEAAGIALELELMEIKGTRQGQNR